MGTVASVHDRLALDLPADVRSLRSARLATLDAASRAGLDCDAANDLCLALDELCFAAFARGGTHDRIQLDIAVDGGVEIQGLILSAGRRFDLSDFADLLLDLAVDAHSMESTPVGLHFMLGKAGPVVPRS